MRTMVTIDVRRTVGLFISGSAVMNLRTVLGKELAQNGTVTAVFVGTVAAYGEVGGV